MDRTITYTKRRKKDAQAVANSFRVLVIGAPDTGKKCLVARYTHGNFDESKAKRCDDSFSLGIIKPTDREAKKRSMTGMQVSDLKRTSGPAPGAQGFLCHVEKDSLSPRLTAQLGEPAKSYSDPSQRSDRSHTTATPPRQGSRERAKGTKPPPRRAAPPRSSYFPSAPDDAAPPPPASAPLVPSESSKVPTARQMADSESSREAPKAVGLFSLLKEDDRDMLTRSKKATRPRTSPVISDSSPVPKAATMGFLSMLDSEDKEKMDAKTAPQRGTTVGFLGLIDDGARDSLTSVPVASSKSDNIGGAFSKLMSSADLQKLEMEKKAKEDADSEKLVAHAPLMINDRTVQTSFKFLQNLEGAEEEIQTAHGFLFIFSVASRKSFAEVQRMLFAFSHMKRQGQHSILLVGTMNDDLSRIVSDIEGKNLAKKYEVDYSECSAKNNSGVDPIFQDILAQMDFEHGAFPRWFSSRFENKDKLSVAVHQRNLPKIKQLLATKNPRAKTKNGWSPMHSACWEGYYEIVYMFIQVQVDCVNCRSTDDWTPLHVAARMGFLSIVDLLVDSGADVLARDSHKSLATSSRFVSIRELLKKRVESRVKNLNIKAKSHVEKVISEGWQSTELDMSKISCRHVPESIFQLEHLSRLSFLGNNLVELDPRVSMLKQLKVLIIGMNELTFIPESIGELKNLTELDLRNNKLASLPASIGSMRNLRKLLLLNNSLSYLPSQLGQLEDTLEILDVYNNPLNTIPQDVIPKLGCIYPSEMGQLFAYLRGIGTDGDDEYFRVKMMFVGDGNVGKTSLLNCFLEKDKRRKLTKIDKKSSGGSALSVSSSASNTSVGSDKEPTDTIATDGIDINDVSVLLPSGQEMMWDCWDYAGQEIYYTTHQFFLSHRSIYLIVFNLLDRNFSKTEYWLNSIHTRARGSPIILVGTHVDDKECTHEYLTKYMDDLLSTVKPERFKSKLGVKSVKGVYTVSSRKRIGIRELMDGITDVVVKAKLVGQRFPATWLRLEATLSALREGGETPFLKWEDFERVAAGCSVPAGSVKDAALFLHTIGALCFFDDPRSGLDQLVVLDPQFLTNVMSAVITLKHRYGQDTRKEGIITSLDMQHIWREFPKDMVPTFMGLLQSFEITFQLPREGSEAHDTYIIPSLLSLQQPDLKPHWSLVQGQRAEGLVFARVYDFEFLPLGFFSRLIVRNFHLPNIEKVSYWRNGMVLKRNNTLGLIRYNPSSYKLNLEVHNRQADVEGLEYADAVKLLRVLLENIDTTIEGWYETKTTVSVPCSHCIMEGSYSRWDFNLEECLQSVTEAVGFVLCRNIRRIRMDVLAPDLSFADLKRLLIPYSAISLDRVIGEGAFGTVYKGTLNGNAVAVKRLNTLDKKVASEDSSDSAFTLASTSMQEEDEEDLKSKFAEFQREVWIMSCMKHPNVCGLIGICANPMAMVMDYLGEGDLYHSIGTAEQFDKPTLSEKDQKKLAKRNLMLEKPLQLKIALDIARGMAHLHSFSPQIIHRDLRSPNIFLKTLDVNAPARALVGDFGLSRMVAPTLAGGEFNANWLAPEVMRNEAYTAKMDVYGFGVVFWEVMTGLRPFAEFDEEFAGKPQAIFYQAVIEGLRPTMPTKLNKNAQQIIADCWQDDPDKRPDFDEIVGRLKTVLREESVDVVDSDDEGEDEEEEALRNSQLHEIGANPIDQREIASIYKRLTPSHPHSVQVLCEAVAGQFVWAGTANGEIWIWDVKTYKYVKSFAVPNSARIYDMISVGEHVWVAGADGMVPVFSKDTCKKIAHLSEHHGKAVRSMLNVQVEVAVKRGKPVKEDRVWTADIDGCICVWRLRHKKKPKLRLRIRLGRVVTCMHRHNDVICCGTDGPIIQVDVNTHQTIGQWEGHRSLVNSIVSYKSSVWSCSNDGTIRIWALGQREPIREPLAAHTAKILCMIAVSGVIWTGSFDMTIGVWDPEKYQLIQELNSEHKDGVRSLISPSGDFTEVWSGGMERDPDILVWRVDTFAC